MGNNMTLKARILEQLNKQKLSKADLIRLSGVKKSTIYTFFQRETELQLETLRPIAKTLGVSLNYLIYGEEISKPHTLTDDEKYLLALFNELAESSQKLCISSIEGMVLAEKGELPKVKHYLQNLEKELK